MERECVPMEPTLSQESVVPFLEQAPGAAGGDGGGLLGSPLKRSSDQPLITLNPRLVLGHVARLVYY